MEIPDISESVLKNIYNELDIIEKIIDERIEKYSSSFTYNNDKNPCYYCSNNPKNGGNGICFCTLNLPKIT